MTDTTNHNQVGRRLYTLSMNAFPSDTSFSVRSMTDSGGGFLVNYSSPPMPDTPSRAMRAGDAIFHSGRVFYIAAASSGASTSSLAYYDHFNDEAGYYYEPEGEWSVRGIFAQDSDNETDLAIVLEWHRVFRSLRMSLVDLRVGRFVPFWTTEIDVTSITWIPSYEFFYIKLEDSGSVTYGICEGANTVSFYSGTASEISSQTFTHSEAAGSSICVLWSDGESVIETVYAAAYDPDLDDEVVTSSDVRLIDVSDSTSSSIKSFTGDVEVSLVNSDDYYFIIPFESYARGRDVTTIYRIDKSTDDELVYADTAQTNVSIAVLDERPRNVAPYFIAPSDDVFFTKPSAATFFGDSRPGVLFHLGNFSKPVFALSIRRQRSGGAYEFAAWNDTGTEIVWQSDFARIDRDTLLFDFRDDSFQPAESRYSYSFAWSDENGVDSNWSVSKLVSTETTGVTEQSFLHVLGSKTIVLPENDAKESSTLVSAEFRHSTASLDYVLERRQIRADNLPGAREFCVNFADDSALVWSTVLPDESLWSSFSNSHSFNVHHWSNMSPSDGRSYVFRTIGKDDDDRYVVSDWTAIHFVDDVPQPDEPIFSSISVLSLTEPAPESAVSASRPLRFSWFNGSAAPQVPYIRRRQLGRSDFEYANLIGTSREPRVVWTSSNNQQLAYGFTRSGSVTLPAFFQPAGVSFSYWLAVGSPRQDLSTLQWCEPVLIHTLRDSSPEYLSDLKVVEELSDGICDSIVSVLHGNSLGTEGGDNQIMESVFDLFSGVSSGNLAAATVIGVVKGITSVPNTEVWQKNWRSRLADRR